RARRLFQNVPSIHAGYLAAIFEKAGHDVRITNEDYVDGDIALILSSLGDYRHEIEWAQEAKRKFGMRVGFFGAPATHLPEILEGQVDCLMQGEPEQPAMPIAAGELPAGTLATPAIDGLDSMPVPAWHLFNPGRHAVGRSKRAARYSFPLLSSRSCPEFC